MPLGIRHRSKQPQRFAPARGGSLVSDAADAAIHAEALAADGLLGLRVDSRKCAFQPLLDLSTFHVAPGQAPPAGHRRRSLL